jgi:crossover junction endodeoxyribonuclease RuvC
MTIDIGIDPGLNGALVALQNGHPIEWTMMPTYMVGTHRRVNCAAVAAWLKQFPAEDTKVYMELVGAMPGQGVVSMFSFGHAAGSIMGVLGALDQSVRLIPPQQWKKLAKLTGKDKDASRSLAIQLWPEWRAMDKKGEGQAYADAALIAEYGGGE